MSHCLLLNLEDFSLSQDITQTIQSHTRFCICCLEKNDQLIYLESCMHSDFLLSFSIPDLKSHDQVVCYQCHLILKKIKQFGQQVQESFKLLTDEKFKISETNLRTTKLKTEKTVDILIPTNSEEQTNRLAPISTEQTGKCENEVLVKKTECTRLKNIQTALDIIDGNNSVPLLGLLSGIKSLTNDVLGSVVSESLNVKKIGTPPSAGGYVKTEERSGDPLQTSVDTKIAATESLIAKSFGTTPSVDEDVKVKDSKGESHHGSPVTCIGLLNHPVNKALPTKCFETTPSVCDDAKTEKKIDRASFAAGEEPTPKRKSQHSNPIRTVKLTKKQLMRERYLLSWSKAYLKYPYKCQNCIQGFNYKENLEDHVARKHDTELGNICEICLQVHPAGMLNTHTSKHYTRYMCLKCSRKFSVRDDAVYHYARRHVMRYKCGSCGYVVEDLQKMQSHRAKRHRFLCEECGGVFATSRRLRWHVMVKHKNGVCKENEETVSVTELPGHTAVNSYCIQCDVNLTPTHICSDQRQLTIIQE